MANEIQRRIWRVKAKERYWSEPERRREMALRWRLENPERSAEVSREYRKRRKERMAREAVANQAKEHRP